MKVLVGIFAFFAVVIASFAQEAKTNATPALTFSASAAKLSAPFVLTNGCISQPELTDVAAGGKAVFSFTITIAGPYVVEALVNAPDDSSNSLFVNVDAQPEDPLMIWDIETAGGFEKRTVSWRGNGSDGNAEFAPKVFTLAAGAHQLVIVGREPVQLKSVSLRPAVGSK